MTKFYRAKVSLSYEVEFRVAAEDETGAMLEARQEALKVGVHSQKVINVSLALESEADLRVGTRIKHFLFGEGTLETLEMVTNGEGRKSFRSRVQFLDKPRDLVLMLSGDKIEILD